VKVDIASDAQVKEAVNDVGNKHGHINYLVNSAGIQTYGTAEILQKNSGIEHSVSM
jgi:NAD(P)-dependent dehydrogenase (short-subunit alcohol dehydrogenase family)